VIKTLFFDIGNVLIYFSYQKMCEQIGDICEITGEEVNQQLRENNFGERHETGEISSEELHQHFVTHSGKEISKEEFLEAACSIFHPNYSLWPTVKSLKRRGIKLLLLSNTCDSHFQYIEKNYEIIQEFDYQILSHQVNARKPDRLIFESALQICGCDPEECFYVDDIPEYIEAARNLNIDAEVFTETESFLKHLAAREIPN
jgi:HAD superfamily hydrolase (TIGR01509 family)